MKEKGKWLAWFIILAGALIGAAGAAFVFMYFREAIVARIGEPDQSLIFWYLPVLFIGVAGCASGAMLIRYALKRRKQSSRC